MALSPNVVLVDVARNFSELGQDIVIPNSRTLSRSFLALLCLVYTLRLYCLLPIALPDPPVCFEPARRDLSITRNVQRAHSPSGN